MPGRSPRPWFHKKSGYWCTSKRGRRIYLDKDYNVAASKLRALRVDDERENQCGTEWLDAPFVRLADEFMEDIKARRAEATYSGYRYRLRRALRILGPQLRVGEIRKLHLAKIERELTGAVSPTTRWQSATAASRLSKRSMVSTMSRVRCGCVRPWSRCSCTTCGRAHRRARPWDARP